MHICMSLPFYIDFPALNLFVGGYTYRSNSQVGSSANECERTKHFPCKESFAGG